MTDTAITKTYQGNCHCGAVKFTLTIPPLENQRIFNCNCSMCDSHGLLNVHCSRKDLTFIRGEDMLTGYKYRSPEMSFRFCKVCGVGVVWDTDEPEKKPDFDIAVTIRTLQGVDLDSFRYIRYNGKADGEPYVVPEQ